MARSYKKNPFGGHTSSSGQKAFRSQENRAKRSKVRQQLKTEQYDSLPDEKEYGNEWVSPRDGKVYWKPTKQELNQCNTNDWLAKVYTKILRK